MSIYIQKISKLDVNHLDIKVTCQRQPLTYKNWNLISQEHFGHKLRTRFFPEC